MKRITTVLLAMVFMFGSVHAAQADGIDIKVKGQWDFAFGWVNNRVFKKSYNNSNPGARPVTENAPKSRRRDDDNFAARQRIRTQVNFITSEYLQAVLMFEIGDLDWGRGGSVGRSSGGALDADGVNIETKRAYLDWIIPNTEVSVRMGLQGLKLPSGRMGNPVFDADVAAVVVSSPITDWLSATVFWARPFDAYRNDSTAGFGGKDNLSDEVDMFGLVLPVAFDGWSVSPYFVYTWVGNSSGIYDYMFNEEYTNTVYQQNSGTKVWWIGTNFNLDIFDPLVFNMDMIYGRLHRTTAGGLFGDGTLGSGLADNARFSASGWYIGATLDYKLDWGTPGLFGWWASGDRKNAQHDGHIGRIPVLGTDGGFTATSFGTAGYYGIGNGNNAAAVTNTAAGTWGIGIQLADVSFIEDLSHTLRFAYYRGTNDSDVVKYNGNNGNDGGREFLRYGSDNLYLTTKDSVFEVNFDHIYKIYENLEVCLELGWLNLRSNESTWRGSGSNLKRHDNAWKGEVNFRYSF